MNNFKPDYEIAMKHVGMWADKCEYLAYMLYRVAEGDDVDNIFETLHEYGFVDENHEWIYDEE
jgi:hypothetical protein